MRHGVLGLQDTRANIAILAMPNREGVGSIAVTTTIPVATTHCRDNSALVAATLPMPTHLIASDVLNQSIQR